MRLLVFHSNLHDFPDNLHNTLANPSPPVVTLEPFQVPNGKNGINASQAARPSKEN